MYSVLIIAAATSGIPAPVSLNTGNGGHVLYIGTAYMKSATDPFVDIRWITPAGNAARRLSGTSLPKEIMANVSCKTAKSGRLSGCALTEVSPDRGDVRRSVQAFVRDLRINRRFLGTSASKAKSFAISLRVINPRGFDTESPCLPPWCNVTPAPPPVSSK